MDPSFSVEIEACIAGDERAWTRLITRYAPTARVAVRAIFRYPERCLQGRRAHLEDVEDLVQDTFLSLVENDYRRLRAFDSVKTRFSTWISLLARRRALETFRRRRIVAVSLDEARDISAPDSSGESAAFSMPDGVLTSRERSVIELSFRACRSLEEIGGELGIGYQAVKNHKSSGLRKLRYHFQEKKPPPRPSD